VQDTIFINPIAFSLFLLSLNNMDSILDLKILTSVTRVLDHFIGDHDNDDEEFHIFLLFMICGNRVHVNKTEVKVPESFHWLLNRQMLTNSIHSCHIVIWGNIAHAKKADK